MTGIRFAPPGKSGARIQPCAAFGEFAARQAMRWWIENTSVAAFEVRKQSDAILAKRYASFHEKWLFENTTACLIFVSVAKVVREQAAIDGRPQLRRTEGSWL
jgi:hypothetical protein